MPEAEAPNASSLSEMKFKSEALARLGLPDILYPVTPGAFVAALGNGGELPLVDMLYGLQLRARDGTTNWKALEPALDRLAELIAPGDARDIIEVGGETWWLEIGPVDLGQQIVTIQRQQLLIRSHLPARRRPSAGGELSAARCQECELSYRTEPSPPSGTRRVHAREQREYALDCSAGMGDHYAFDRGEAHDLVVGASALS